MTTKGNFREWRDNLVVEPWACNRESPILRPGLEGGRLLVRAPHIKTKTSLGMQWSIDTKPLVLFYTKL